MAKPQTAVKQTSGLVDTTPDRTYFDYDIPEELHPESKTIDFGAIRVVTVKLLTPLEDKRGIAGAKGDPLAMAFELAKISIHSVTDDGGNEHAVRAQDGTLDMLWAQMHPKIRTLVTQAYSENAAPTERASASFLKSRKMRA